MKRGGNFSSQPVGRVRYQKSLRTRCAPFTWRHVSAASNAVVHLNAERVECHGEQCVIARREDDVENLLFVVMRGQGFPIGVAEVLLIQNFVDGDEQGFFGIAPAGVVADCFDTVDLFLA